MLLTDLLSDIAEAIRSMDGSDEKIPATDFAEHILAIPTGMKNIAIGSFTPTEDTATWVVNHELPETPNFSITASLVQVKGVSIGTRIIMLSYSTTYPYSHYLKPYSNWGNYSVTGSETITNDTYSDTSVAFNTSNSDGTVFRAGYQYVWIIGTVS